MGGQACVFYGAAEFSRNIDFALMADEENLKRLKKAMSEDKAYWEPLKKEIERLRIQRRVNSRE